MAFKPGEKKPPGSGRKKGSKNKKTVLKIGDFIIRENINIAKEIWDTIQLITDPVQKHKALIEFYRFVDAPVKDKSGDSDEKALPEIVYMRAE